MCLGKHPFMQGLPRSHAVEMRKLAMIRHFPQGHLLFDENEPAEHFFLIRLGVVLLESSKPYAGKVIVQKIGAGEALGWSWFVPPHFWRFSARALTPVEAISFDGPALRQLCRSNHELGFEMFTRLSAVTAARVEHAKRALNEHDPL